MTYRPGNYAEWVTANPELYAKKLQYHRARSRALRKLAQKYKSEFYGLYTMELKAITDEED